MRELEPKARWRVEARGLALVGASRELPSGEKITHVKNVTVDLLEVRENRRGVVRFKNLTRRSSRSLRGAQVVTASLTGFPFSHRLRSLFNSPHRFVFSWDPISYRRLHSVTFLQPLFAVPPSSRQNLVPPLSRSLASPSLAPARRLYLFDSQLA